MSERVKHPSFANLYIGRSQSSGKVALFGSSIKHHDRDVPQWKYSLDANIFEK